MDPMRSRFARPRKISHLTQTRRSFRGSLALAPAAAVTGPELSSDDSPDPELAALADRYASLAAQEQEAEERLGQLARERDLGHPELDAEVGALIDLPVWDDVEAAAKALDAAMRRAGVQGVVAGGRLVLRADLVLASEYAAFVTVHGFGSARIAGLGPIGGDHA